MGARPIIAGLERLECRRLLSAVAPSDYEQYMLELVNRARANPLAEAARYGIDLNEGIAPGTISSAAKQPLAFNPFLVDAARQHSQWMIDNDVFSHTGAGGSNPGDRMASAGYASAGTFGYGENIAYRGQKPSTPPPTSTTAQEHADLFIDAGIEGRGHRTNLMNGGHKEVGIGIATGNYQTYNALMSTQDFGSRSGNSFLTGVAYDDSVTADSFYTPGEGLGSVTITAVGAGGTFSTTTWASGGYALQLPAGTYTVTASGGELASPVQFAGVAIGSSNVKQDVRPGVSPPASPPTSPPSSPPVSPPTVPPPPAVPPPPPSGAVGALVWNDLNADGRRQRREPGLSGRVLYLDLNDDGTRQDDEPQQTTRDDGYAAFLDLDLATYQVRLVDAAGWRVTSVGGSARTATVTGSRSPKLPPFGITETVAIRGNVFADANADGVRDVDDGPFRKAKLYVDVSGDGMRQPGEPTAKVARDGTYTLRGFAPGIYTVRLIIPAKFAPSTAAPLAGIDVSAPGAESLGNDFGIRLATVP